MIMANPIAVPSIRSRLAHTAASLLGRYFAWVGGIAIGLALGLGRLAPAILGEIGMQFLLLALWFRWVVKLFAWLCILAAALLQYQSPGTERQNLLMLGAGLVAMVVERGLTVLHYRIRQHRMLLMAGVYPSALRFRTARDEPFS
jgi:hypothetical protein